MSSSIPQELRRLIAHVDLDAFFASCEQRDTPAYRDKPVVVGALPGNRGVVAAASYEARAFGIHSAMPISEAFRRCPDAVFLRPNMQKYQDASQTVFEALNQISPAIEKASIDEAYLDLSGLTKLLGSAETMGRRIKQCVFDASGLTASVGIGPNRLIAKLASDFNKPNGLTVVPFNEVSDFLSPLPASALRGAGKKTQQVFGRLGINTIADLRSTPTERLAEHLGRSAAENFKRQALGQGSATVSTTRSRKSISKERTFQHDAQPDANLRSDLADLARQVAQSARQKKLAGRVIRLKVRYRGFDTYTRQITLPEPTNDERVIAAQAWSLFRDGDLPQKLVRLIGVGLCNWEAERGQGDLFADASSRDQRKILDVIDDVSARFGHTKLKLGTTRNRK